MESLWTATGALPCRLNGLCLTERSLAAVHQRGSRDRCQKTQVQHSLVLVPVSTSMFALPCRLQRAGATIEDLEAALHQKDELLQQKQDASGDRQIALHGELVALERRMPVLQEKHDLAKWRGRDTQYLSRQLCTVHNSRVEAMLELQAM